VDNVLEVWAPLALNYALRKKGGIIQEIFDEKSGRLGKLGAVGKGGGMRRLEECVPFVVVREIGNGLEFGDVGMKANNTGFQKNAFAKIIGINTSRFEKGGEIRRERHSPVRHG
jgi:hypothetical protein